MKKSGARWRRRGKREQEMSGREETERWVGVGWGTERRRSRCCWKRGEAAAEGGSLSGLLRLKFQSTPEGGRFWSSCLRSECTWRASRARASARGSASGSGSANASVTCQPTPLKRLCHCLWLWHCLTPTSHRIGASFPPPLSFSLPSQFVHILFKLPQLRWDLCDCIDPNTGHSSRNNNSNNNNCDNNNGK